MANSRVLINFICRRQLLPSTVSICTNHLHFPLRIPHVNYAAQKSIEKSHQDGSDGQVQTSFGEKVKENTKSAWYLSVIVGGVGVTAIMFYAIFRELFSSKSPNSVYDQAMKRCLQDSKVSDCLGEPIKAYGEETRRGRRGHVSHTIYEQDGVRRLRMKFYLQGLRRKATVHLEMREDSKGNWIYRYLFIETMDLSRRVIVLEDNRDIERMVYNNIEDPPGIVSSELKSV